MQRTIASILVAAALLGVGTTKLRAQPTFGPPTRADAPFAVMNLRAVEVNGDGDLDLLVNSGDGRRHLLLGSLGPDFVPSATFVVPTGVTPSADLNTEFVDLTGDGTADLVTVENGIGFGYRAMVHVWPGSGGAAFGARLDSTIGGITAAAFVVDDIDGVAGLDVLFGESSTAGPALFTGRNDGAGTFTQARTSGPPVGVFIFRPAYFDLIAADLGDGPSLDVAVIEQAGFTGAFDPTVQNIEIFSSDGDGTFTHRTTVAIGAPPPPTTAPSNALRLVRSDLDGDGLSDLVFSSRVPGRECGIILNQSATTAGGGFAFGAITPLPVLGPIADLEAVDIDGDLDIDIVVLTNSTSPDERYTLFLGDGTGSFAAPIVLPANDGVETATRLEIADYDGDGLLDLAHGTADGAVWMSLQSAPAECWMLLGARPGNRPVEGGGLGDRLLIANLAALWPVTIPTVPVLPIPNWNSLVGVELYFQVAMVNPVAFPQDPVQMSNGLKATIGGATLRYGVGSGVDLWAPMRAMPGQVFQPAFRITR